MKLYDMIFEKEAPTKQSIVRVLLILTAITFVEVGFALCVLVLNEPPQSHETMYWVYRVSMILLSLGKAFFIVASALSR